jgi:hypothetical protein
MKKLNFLKLTAAFLFVVILSAPVLSYKLGGKDMVKNGTGQRTMAFMTIYYASLYVPQELKGASDTAIINADEPMSIFLTIDSGLVDRDKFVKSVTEAFAKSASAGYASSDTRSYLNMFNDITIVKGDRFTHHYNPKSGMTVKYRSKASGSERTLGVIKGLQFKKAFYGMFLSSKPIQSGLKKGMLGK